ncbi:carbohydrate-binding module family 5 protein [Botryobasidium botryosum FD-172 SS1]|uniref:chitinase n=1 Tax=Botryobasidium botryosum (strain FD-172 SS1) TaxID=930990 RepID=A0A067MC61_BOTB1|nr:carbohydrate-binding module family 5 protein [Botryobasidium botryosum FD-172 SS1]
MYSFSAALAVFLFVSPSFFPGTFALGDTCNDNLAVYWGQNSYGAAHSDQQNFQRPLSFYCQDDSIDVFPLAFLNVFFGPGGEPEINLANVCNPTDNATFPGTDLANCESMAQDIATCQAKGKKITISLGGATGGGAFSNDNQAKSFADQIWNLFLGGSSSTRPFGAAVLDGVDLDIEGGGGSGYIAFVNQLRSHYAGASKKYYITGAPQCVYPDGAMSPVLNAAVFDAVYVQFYNNACGLPSYPGTNWNFGTWDIWARTISLNKNVKIYIGAPAAPSAAGSGYQELVKLRTIAQDMRSSFPSFGGVMLWDASQAYDNNRYDRGVKDFLKAGSSCGAFQYPACSAPAWASGTTYPAGTKVTYEGYIWEARYSASDKPDGLASSSSWSPINACAGASRAPPPPSHTTTTTRPPTTTAATPPTKTTVTPPSLAPTGTPGSCSGIPAWLNSVAYPNPTKVTYNGHIWQNTYWTQAGTPGGSAGVWTDLGPCASKSARISRRKPTAWHFSPDR